MTKLLLLLLLSVLGAFAQSSTPPCNQKANITISASGTTVVATPAGSQNIYVCSVVFTSSTAVNVTFYGGASPITGTFLNVTTFTYNFNGSLTTGAGNTLGINLASTATVGGVVTYFQGQ